MRTLEMLLWLGGGLICGGGYVHVKDYGERVDLRQEVIVAHADSRYDRQVADQLLSKGRFVRQWDARSGNSIYTFKVRK